MSGHVVCCGAVFTAKRIAALFHRLPALTCGAATDDHLNRASHHTDDTHAPDAPPSWPACAAATSPRLVTVLALVTPLVIASAWVFANVQHSEQHRRDRGGPAGLGPQGSRRRAPGEPTSSSRRRSSSRSPLAAGISGFAAGRYVFLLDITAQEALNTLRGGPAAEIPDIPLLLPPGLSMTAIADRVGKLPGKSKDRFLAGRVVGRRPIGVRAGRRELARRSHLARHLPDRRQRDRGPDPLQDRPRVRQPRRRRRSPERAEPGGAHAVPGVGGGVAHPGRVGKQRGLAAHLRGDREPSPRQDAAPDRRHAVLREGWLPAGAGRRRQEDRLAVQHVQGDGAPTHADRDGRREVRSRRR